MKERIRINSDAIELRRRFGEDAGSPVDIFALLGAIKDLTVVFCPMSDNISGMTVKDEGIRLIAINSRLSKGRQRFTAAHELCHLYFHTEFRTIVCAKDIAGTRTDLEKEADLFASFFLAPYESLHHFIQVDMDRATSKLTMDDVIRIEQYFGMSHQATLVRLQADKFITASESQALEKNVISTARRLGYTTDLYLPTPEGSQYMTTGSYLRLADELYTKGAVSSGKYEEWLLDAYRSDIVYGDNASEEDYD